MLGPSADLRARASVVCGAVGVVLIAATYFSVSGQWADHCSGRFGATDGVLVLGGVVGLAAIGLGFRSDEELERHGGRFGLVLGFVTLFALLVVYLSLASRGCGD